MIFNSAELRETLKKVKVAVYKGTSVSENIKCIHFNSDIIYAYNNRMYAQIQYPTGLICSVSAENLYSIISGISEAEVELTTTESSLEIKTPTLKAKLPLLSSEPIFMETVNIFQNISSEVTFYPLPEDFWEGILMCEDSTTNDETKNTLVNYHISGNVIETSDEIRLSRYSLNFGNFIDVLIPSEEIMEVEEVAASCKINKYFVTDSIIYFYSEDSNTFFAIRLINGKYPDVVQMGLLEKTNYYNEVFKYNSAELKQSLLPIISMAKGSSGTDVVAEKGVVKFFISSHTGDVCRTVPITVDETDKPMTFIIHLHFLLKVLDKTSSFVLSRDGSKVVFTSEDNKFTQLISTIARA